MFKRFGILGFALAVCSILIPNVVDGAVVYHHYVYHRHPVYGTYHYLPGYRYGYWRYGHYHPYLYGFYDPWRHWHRY